MTSQKKESIELDNGLTMKLYDASRKIAADRWRVKLKVEIDIAVADAHFNAVRPPAPLAQLRTKLGDNISYTYEDERNFVDQRDKEAIFGQMQASVLAKKPYYSHPDFAARFLIKEFVRCQHLPDAAD